MSKLNDLLKESGIADEVVSQVYECINKSGEWLPKYRFDEVNNEKNNYKVQIDEYNTQIKALQKSVGDNEELNKQIQKMKDDMKELNTKHELELKAFKKESIIKNELTKWNVHDVDVVFSKLNGELIQYDDKTGLLTGLNEQKENMLKNNAWLFKDSGNAIAGGYIPPTGNPIPQPQQTEKTQAEKNMEAYLAQFKKGE